MIKPSSMILKITFDAIIEGVLYENIELNYTPDEADITNGWCLSLEDLHQEDNDSWCMFQAGNDTYDCQFFGIDDSLAYDEVTDEYSPKLALKIPLSYQLNLMERNDVDCYEHTDTWLYENEAKFINIQIHTKDGIVKL